MKTKFLLLISIGLMLFAACEPNQDIYDEYEANQKPYSENLEITLTDADYTSLKKYALAIAEDEVDTANANAIDTYNSFSPNRSAETIIPFLLESSYIALDSSSAIGVTYNYDNSYIFSDDLIDIDTNLINTTTFDTYCKARLAEIFTAPVEGDKCVFKYNVLSEETIVTPDTIYIDSNYVSTKSLYYYNGSAWSIPTNAFILTKDDYNNMGEANNTQPGYYDNFSSTVKPETFLPTYLKIKYPYTSAGAELQIIYDYFSGSAQVHYNKYFFDGTDWNYMEEKTSQFIQNGTAWFFDPTVRYTMTKPDYQIIVDYIINDPVLSVYKDPVYTNNEWYYGASAYYGNYDLRPFKHRTFAPAGTYDDLTDTEIYDILIGRISESVIIMLTGKYPDAEPFINGIPVYYLVTFDTYEPERHKYTVKCLCTDTGVFEFVEGPIQIL